MKMKPAKDTLLRHICSRKESAIIYPEMYQKDSEEACDSQISQVKRSDCQTTAAGQLTDSL